MPYQKRNKLKILLLQIREDACTIEEEIINFANFGEIDACQVSTINAFKTHHFKPQILDDYDALMVGGSSDASVLKPKTYPFVKSCRDLIGYSYHNNIPTFASCFGFQLAAVELGGEIILDKPNMEMGIINIKLLDNYQSYPLLKGMPQNFMAVSGHKERVSVLPNGAINLAASEKCPYHLFTFANKPFYASQFHPEVDRETLIQRLTRYQHHYLSEKGELEKIIKSSKNDTPLSNALVKQFIDRVVL